MDANEQRARELLAAEYERDEFDIVQARQIREGYVTNTTATALRAIMAALAQQVPADGEAGTPAARWRKEGKPDPHGTRYDCERAALAGGDMTDCEVANAVYLDPSIVNLTIAKDRIRWLSRKLAATPQAPQPVVDEDGAFEDWLGAIEDAGEIASNARDPMIARRAKRVVAWMEANKPVRSQPQQGAVDVTDEMVHEAKDAYSAADFAWIDAICKPKDSRQTQSPCAQP